MPDEVSEKSGLKKLGIWYPHIYRLSDGEHGFTMIFYSQEPNEEDQELFDRIINSFSFQ
jgi:hypothetical protein